MLVNLSQSLPLIRSGCPRLKSSISLPCGCRIQHHVTTDSIHQQLSTISFIVAKPENEAQINASKHTAFHNLNIAARRARLRSNRLYSLDKLLTVNHFAKDRMLAVEMRCRYGSDEEL